MWYNDFSTIDLSNCSATKSQKKTDWQNRREFWQWLAYFAEMGINRYKITGDYPETLDERTILQGIFWYGSFALFEDNGVWLSLPAMPENFTIYGYPTRARVFGRNGYNKEIGVVQYNGDEKIVNVGAGGYGEVDKNGFFIQEKKFYYPLANSAIITAERVADAMRSIDVMRVLLKTPFVVFCIEEMRRTVEEYFKKIDRNIENYIKYDWGMERAQLHLIVDEVFDNLTNIGFSFRNLKHAHGIGNNNEWEIVKDDDETIGKFWCTDDKFGGVVTGIIIDGGASMKWKIGQSGVTIKDQ